jgi:hypothetical protein
MTLIKTLTVEIVLHIIITILFGMAVVGAVIGLQATGMLMHLTGKVPDPTTITMEQCI